ncbi:MAG: DUF1476 domain-containing protein [Rhodospirillaceae bacterium]
MTDAFREREKGFEAKYQHDQEHLFRVIAKRNKLFGLWAAEELGLSGDDAEAYAKTVVESDLTAPGDDDVVGKVLADLQEKGVDINDHRLHLKLQKFQTEAETAVSAKEAE